MAKLTSIEGISKVYESQLKRCGVHTVEALLERGCRPQGRHELAEAAEISPKLILTWINYADLFRIRGIGGQYAELLEAAGVDTVAELAQRRPEHLNEQLEKANRRHKHRLVSLKPGLKRVTAWIEEAKSLPRVVSY